MKRISKQEAAEKYGIITTGVNSLYTYYLREDGCVVDSDGDIRYKPQKDGEGPILFITKAIKESGVFNPLDGTIILTNNDIEHLAKKILWGIKGEQEK